MNPTVRNALAVLAGVLVGMIVNMSLILASPHIIPPPAGADVTTAEGLKASLHLFAPRHFIFPFLAHALGTFAGVLVAVRLAASRHRTLAFAIGAVFLAGGIANVTMLPAPAWFNALDLVGAYLPMAWLGAQIGARRP